MLEETRLDHAIRSSIAITKLQLGCDILKKNKKNKKEKCDFKNKFCPYILLSYSTYSIITGLGTQQVNVMENFCIKAGI